MEKAFETISLIPYIESAGGGFRMEIALADPRAMEASVYPFQLVHAPRPLSRLVRAAVTTGRGATMKQLFLLVQHHDAVPLGPNVCFQDIELHLITLNQVVDNRLIRSFFRVTEEVYSGHCTGRMLKVQEFLLYSR